MMAAVDLPSLFQPCPAAVSVIDPELKLFGRLWLPTAKLLPTNGLTRHQSGHPYPLSLCLLYQKQRCHAGEQCNQIHADRGFISAVRAVLQNLPFSNCCHQHGDLPSTRRDFQGLCQTMRVSFVAGDGVTKFPIASSEVAVTAYWNKWLLEMGNSPSNNQPSMTEVTITPADMCCHHQRSGCKNGVDCKHVHLCRTVFAKIALELSRRVSCSNTPTPTPTPVPVMAPTTANAKKSSPSSTVGSQPVLREQLMGKCLAAAPAASRGSGFPSAGIPACPAPTAVHPSAAERSGFVPLTSWRKGTPQAPQGAAGAEGLSLSAPRVSKKPLPLPLPLEPAQVVPGLGEAGEVPSPTTGDSIARHLIAMSDDWGEPSKCEEEVEKALQHERTAWVGRRAGSSRLLTWGSSLASPVRV